MGSAGRRVSRQATGEVVPVLVEQHVVVELVGVELTIPEDDGRIASRNELG
jgi:hypothetical protein